jgi:hypothetical protein
VALISRTAASPQVSRFVQSAAGATANNPLHRTGLPSIDDDAQRRRACTNALFDHFLEIALKRHLSLVRSLVPCLVPMAALAVLAVLAGCAAPPKDLDLSLQHRSAQGRYMVQMEPPASVPALNQIHAWHIRLKTPDGAPVRAARILVDGGMPQHGHGLPTRPQVTREVAEGTYLMEGMKFSMTGWWEIKLAIQAGAGADTAVFNTVVEWPGAR